MAVALMAVEACFICETDPEIRKGLDPRERCGRCRGRYTSAEVAALLAIYRRLQDHGIHSEYEAKLFAETQIAGDTLRLLQRRGILRDNEVGALVDHLILHQRQDDVAAQIGVAPLTIVRAKKSGLRKLADALNGVF